MPKLFLSLAAAAAAADAYFRGSPGARVGSGAGFMLLAFVPLVVVCAGVCNVDSVGKGDLSCVDGLLAAAVDGSGPAFAFPAGGPTLRVFSS